MDYIYTVVIIIVIIILFWIIFGASTKSRCLSELNGMWIADEEFCQESGVEMMVIYFGDCPDNLEKDSLSDKKNTNKLCWILIMNGNGDHNHITVASLGNGKNIKGDQYSFNLEFQDTPDNLFSSSLEIQIVPGQLITIIDPDTDIKVFEGVKNKEASDAIEFNID